MPYVVRYGMGQTAQQVVGTGFQLGSPVAAAAAGAPVGAALGISASLAIPLVGAALAGVAIAVEALLNSGCGQTCIETSQWANQASAQLDKMMAQYFGVPAPRPQSLQTAALGIFNGIWQQLTQLCSQPNLGAAGQNCISDRQDGACKWKALAPQYPGEPAAGSCWNWFNAYYYPIANDPDVVPDAQVPGAQTSGQQNGGIISTNVASSTGSVPAWLLIAAAGLALWAVM